MKKILTVLAMAALLPAVAQLRSPLLGGGRRGTSRPVNTSRPATTPPTAGGEAAASAPTGGHALNWDGAASDIIIMAYGDEVGKTILKDPACPTATITLKSKQGQKLSREEYLEAIETVLEMNGIHLEPYKDSFIRALPRKDVRKEGIPILMDSETKLGESGKVVSMMIPFTNMTAEDAQKVLEGFKSNAGLLIVFERTNKILVTDTEQNINRMLEIARAIDVAAPVTEQVFVRQIKNASVEEVQKALQAIVDDAMKWQEKNKAPTNPSAQQQQPFRPLRRGILGRNQSAQAQPQPVNNESLVMTVSDADRGMIRGKVLIVPDERSNKLIIITSKANMDFFDKVIEQLDVETTPDTVVKVYRLKYADAEDVSDMINDLIGNSSSSQNKSKNTNQNARQGSGGNITRNNAAAAASQRKPANQRSGEAKAGELSKDNTTVLADKRINGLVVMTNKELVPTIESIIESMDIKLSQVLIETVIIEVSLGDDLNTGVDWVRLGDKRVMNTTTKPRLGSHGLQLYNYMDESGNFMVNENIGDSFDRDGTTWTKVGEGLVDTITEYGRGGFWNSSLHGTAYQSMLGGGGGTGTDTLSAMLNAGTNALSVTPIGSGLNYFIKSDALNLGAVIQASKTDSRSKYLASPVIMTVDNKEATINTTSMKYLLKGFTSSGNSYSTIAVPDYEQKELGIEIKVTPKINPNGTVMLTVETKYSQEGASQSIKYTSGGSNSSESKLQDVAVPTTVTREMSADVLLESMETVVFGGLTETEYSEKETGIPILKDIPWIGKWLFGSVTQTEGRKELLIFMTPYVMDDGASAQAEAIRRKRTLSDPRPWEDNGWSLSRLADPVSKKEQLRRLEDEAKKQDEERRTKLATEKWKIERAKRLQSLTKEERDLWLKMHKEELEEEAQEELEEKMLDEKSQDLLKELAAEIREKKLAEAKVSLEKAAAETAAENERAKRDAEKAAAEEKKAGAVEKAKGE